MLKKRLEQFTFQQFQHWCLWLSRQLVETLLSQLGISTNRLILLACCAGSMCIPAMLSFENLKTKVFVRLDIFWERSMGVLVLRHVDPDLFWHLSGWPLGRKCRALPWPKTCSHFTRFVHGLYSFPTGLYKSMSNCFDIHFSWRHVTEANERV